jgi:hypothetical protein
MIPDASAASLNSPTTVNAPRKRVLWKWSIAITVVVLGFLMWQCGSALIAGRGLSNVAVQQFHAQLNEEQYQQIFADADDAFQRSANKEETINFLQSVHRKLGKAELASLTNITVQATAGRTYVIAAYTTKFERGEAAEKFTWTKTEGQLKLHGYNVQSKVFIIG